MYKRQILKQDNAIKTLSFEPANHYALMLDEFADAVFDDIAVPLPLSDSLANMRAIDALFESVKKEAWVRL